MLLERFSPILLAVAAVVGMNDDEMIRRRNGIALTEVFLQATLQLRCAVGFKALFVDRDLCRFIVCGKRRQPSIPPNDRQLFSVGCQRFSVERFAVADNF